MSDSGLLHVKEKTHASSDTNEQLVTPALTPISEHGVQGDPFVDPWTAENYGTSKPGLVLRSNGSSRLSEVGTKPGSLATISDGSEINVSSAKTSRLSPAQLHDLVSSPENLPVRALETRPSYLTAPRRNHAIDTTSVESSVMSESADTTEPELARPALTSMPDIPSINITPGPAVTHRPFKQSRSASNPMIHRKYSDTTHSKSRTHAHAGPNKAAKQASGDLNGDTKPLPPDGRALSPLRAVLPLPPVSLPTYLQLELSSDRPSALYIHRSAASDIPYESSTAKFERLQNFFMLPPYLEQLLWFGAVACLDSWLYTFTILPLRFLKASILLARWWIQTLLAETRKLTSFIYHGLGRLWSRQVGSVASTPVPAGTDVDGTTSRRPSVSDSSSSRRPSISQGYFDTNHRGNGVSGSAAPDKKPRRGPSYMRHRRSKSTPSTLLPSHKADILQGLLIVISCFILMRLDASRLYHNIRGQAAIKLYVIYNVLEVFDRLFSAIGQDVLECLFSKETLERNANGRSKILRPLWIFMLALIYNIIHSTALFYQVVTLNVAVNSYSNALLTLLMSNQFVEIKGSVFKKFDKENLFQLTCADVVERFQLWLMLLIIALRNIVEVGGLSISSHGPSGSRVPGGMDSQPSMLPLTYGSLVPHAFTLLPKWTGDFLGPFLIVLGSEALVDWCKHGYISKFNQVKPNVYGRFLDVLAKDYYSHAFADQNLTKRLGLPVIPLSCLFIRACVQTYHMFVATYMPPPVASFATSIIPENEAAATAASPGTIAALQHIDQVIRRALGRSSFGSASSNASGTFNWWSVDDVIAFTTMISFFLALYLVLLALKLVLGMALLSFARRRYKGMKEREHQSVETQGRRVGGWGTVEVSEDKRRWIYVDDPEGLQELRDREERGRRRAEKGDRLEIVRRYSMAGKRIW